jgi:hypothetical protein
MNQHEAEKIAKRVSEMHLQLGSLKEAISQCLTAMHFLSDERERAIADKLVGEYIETLYSPVAEPLSKLPTVNMVAFVGTFAALNLAYSSINAYFTAWESELGSALGNKNNTVQ